MPQPGFTIQLAVADLDTTEAFYPLELKPYGTRELWCFDPDGYLVVLEEPVE